MDRKSGWHLVCRGFGTIAMILIWNLLYYQKEFSDFEWSYFLQIYRGEIKRPLDREYRSFLALDG